VISNTLFAQDTSLANDRGLLSGVWQWGQFLDHDIVLTPANPAERGAMLSPGDPYGLEAMPFTRSAYLADPLDGRQQLNGITSLVDASNVYGSDQGRAAALREFAGGRLRTSGGGRLLPTSDMPGLADLPNEDGGLGAQALFVAGDVRANEQFGLIAMHTLFVREHNRIADTLVSRHTGDPTWDDERVYQTARRVVAAEVQAITYEEFLPALLGPYAPDPTAGDFHVEVDPWIANEFATALYRFGHSMLNDRLLLGDDGASVSLAESFFRPGRVMDDPELVEEVLMGLTQQRAQEIDVQLVDGLRNFLFAPAGGVGLDLAALNIQRGRDHGLPDYNSMRIAYGLERVGSFAEITADPRVQEALAELYGSTDNVDAWVGALAEDHLPDASVGPLIAAGLVEQFTRLRDADPRFYTRDPLLWSDEIAAIVDLETLTAMDVIGWNTALNDMPASFFAAPEPTAGLLAIAAAWLVAAFGQRGAGMPFEGREVAWFR
jgi:hypothetical protein